MIDGRGYDTRGGRQEGWGNEISYVQQFPAAHIVLPYCGPQFWAIATAAKLRVSTETRILFILENIKR